MSDIEFQFESNGYTCYIRKMKLGYYCGYVGVSQFHPFYGKHYDELDIDVHGGLSYSGMMKFSEYWLFGFDCAHLGDEIKSQKSKNSLLKHFLSIVRKSLNIPETPEYDYIIEGEERDLSYVIDQCERLALQLEIQMYKVVEHTVF